MDKPSPKTTVPKSKITSTEKPRKALEFLFDPEAFCQKTGPVDN
jgi:hypothetical protein